MDMETIYYIRGISALVILIFLWLNAHWSIAVSFSLIYIFIEVVISNERNVGKS